MNVINIVAKYLEDNGFDGLVSDGHECGCETSDLAPCENIGWDCQPGYKETCGEDCDCGADGPWHITAGARPKE